MVSDLVERLITQLGSKSLEGASFPLVFSVTLKQVQGIINGVDAHALLHLDDVLAGNQVDASVARLQQRSRATFTLGGRGCESQRQKGEDSGSLHFRRSEQEPWQ